MAMRMVGAEVLLLVLTPISLIPQYNALLSARSSAGISASATFLLALAAQSQVTTIVFALSWVPETRYYDTSASASPFSLPQTIMQWLCSLVLLALVLSMNPGSTLHAPDEITIAPSASSDTAISVRTMVILLSVQMVLFLSWFLFGPKGNDYAFFAISAFNENIVNPIMTISIVVAFVLQARVTWTSRDRSSLSRLSLSFQTVTFLALSILWPMRLKLPRGSGKVGVESGLLWEWYTIVGWACVNNAIFALGQAVVLLSFRKPASMMTL